MRRNASWLRSSTGNIGAHAGSDPRRVCSGNATADDQDARRRNPRRAAEQHPAAAVLLFEVVRADMRRHAARRPPTLEWRSGRVPCGEVTRSS